MADGQRQVRVKMYRQGLGDCFLLSFENGQGRSHHMLIDCGAIKSAHAKKWTRPVVRHIHETTKGRLDVLAATHEHWDHVSGFVDARSIFDQIKVKQVWVGWTEQPGNAAADALKTRFKKSKQ